MTLPVVTMPAVTENYVATLLKEKEITVAAVIDDDFDVPEFEDVKDKLDEFWEYIKSDDSAAFVELQSLGFKGEFGDTIDDALIEKLWANNDYKNLKEACLQLFANFKDKRRSLDDFCGHLSRDLKLELTKIGIQDDISTIFEKNLIRLIFIDYHLGREEENDPLTGQNMAVQRAKEKVESIYNFYKAQSIKPLIILMSSRPNVKEHKNDFRDATGILGGMFYFVSKEDLATKDKLFLNMAAFAKSLDTGYKIQSFIDSIEQSLNAVSKKFLKEIKKLNLEDYSYIQKLSLQDDGHPLGDYMLWLYSSYFGHLLFEKDPDVSKHRKILDSITFETALPSHSPPSHQLAVIYKSALFDNSVGELESHPRTPEDDNGNPVKLDFHFGDLFVDESGKKVLMIINAQCDLAFAPDGKRTAVDYILFINGELVEVNKQDTKTPRTELFEHNEQSYRIIWDIKNVVTQIRSNAESWLRSAKFKRIGRLRLPFAVEVQQAFARDLTRVGMPVAPPIYHPIKVRLSSDNWVSHTESKDAAFAYLTKKGERCFFTVDYVFILKTELEKFLTKIQREIDKTTNAKEKDDLEQKRNNLKIFLEKTENWTDIQERSYDPKQDKQINKYIKLFRNATEPKGDFLLINIIDEED